MGDKQERGELPTCSHENEAGSGFTRAQLDAIAMMVQGLLDKALPKTQALQDGGGSLHASGSGTGE